MSTADPRPSHKVSRIESKWQFHHEGLFTLSVRAFRSSDGPCVGMPASVITSVRSGAITLSLPDLNPDTARRFAEGLFKAAEGCEALDQWHLRNPQPIEAAA